MHGVFVCDHSVPRLDENDMLSVDIAGTSRNFSKGFVALACEHAHVRHVANVRSTRTPWYVSYCVQRIGMGARTHQVASGACRVAPRMNDYPNAALFAISNSAIGRVIVVTDQHRKILCIIHVPVLDVRKCCYLWGPG